MIESLQQQNLDEVIDVYIQGLHMQTPPGDADYESIKNKLENDFETIVYFDNDNLVKGLLTYQKLEIEEKRIIKCGFFCSIESRKGIGRKLMNKLFEIAKDYGAEYILSRASSQDNRVMRFYESMGFETYDEEIMRDDFKLLLVRKKV